MKGRAVTRGPTGVVRAGGVTGCERQLRRRPLQKAGEESGRYRKRAAVIVTGGRHRKRAAAMAAAVTESGRPWPLAKGSAALFCAKMFMKLLLK